MLWISCVWMTTIQELVWNVDLEIIWNCISNRISKKIEKQWLLLLTDTLQSLIFLLSENHRFRSHLQHHHHSLHNFVLILSSTDLVYKKKEMNWKTRSEVKRRWWCGGGEATYTEKTESKRREIESTVKAKWETERLKLLFESR